MNPQPGWYASPNEPGRLRWWDGARWTHTTAPQSVPGQAPASSSTTPAAAEHQRYSPGYAAAPASTVPAAGTTQHTGAPHEREWVWGFIYRRPLKTDALVWWSGTIVALTVVGYILISEGVAGFLIDVAFALPLNYIFLVLPLAALRHWLSVDVREMGARRRAAKNKRPGAGQRQAVTVRVGTAEVIFRRSPSGKVTAAARQGTLDAQTLERAKARLRATQKAAGERPWVTG
jgi:hypothetical protein